MKNPFEARKKRGVIGSVPTRFNSIKVYDKSLESIVLYVGELNENSFDFGFEINLLNGSHLRRLPGQGNTWFENYNDAEAYAAYAVKIGFSDALTSGAKSALIAHINKILTTKLDLL